ncbi:MAG: DUF4345 domain-containing protein [Pseudomonadota bacterium]
MAAMNRFHKSILCGVLIFLGVSLVVPGLIEMFKSDYSFSPTGKITVDVRNQHRALHGMMVGLGLLAFTACFDIEKARNLVLWLGATMALLVIARLYSLMVDGIPGTTTLIYLFIETVLAMIFLLFPPAPYR